MRIKIPTITLNFQYSRSLWALVSKKVKAQQKNLKSIPYLTTFFFIHWLHIQKIDQETTNELITMLLYWWFRYYKYIFSFFQEGICDKNSAPSVSSISRLLRGGRRYDSERKNHSIDGILGKYSSIKCTKLSLLLLNRSSTHLWILCSITARLSYWTRLHLHIYISGSII